VRSIPGSPRRRGLEQYFDSLHAQREACEAYIKSQAHEGWKLVNPAYDDGGFSGGNMERPALQRLLAALGQGLIDVVVVYKIDRLTRSLADFARIVEALDRHNASFVSITQQFNTTTSMGRLTLNVLLSFAQFEREVTGERIRDKIAASWMGGNLPLGYDVRDRELVVNEAEAATVKYLFQTYAELGTVSALMSETRQRGIVSKLWTSSTGKTRGGAAYSRGAVYYLLRNPLYVGRISHRGATYAGLHPSIVPQDLWDTVQAMRARGGDAGSHEGRGRSRDPASRRGRGTPNAGRTGLSKSRPHCLVRDGAFSCIRFRASTNRGGLSPAQGVGAVVVPAIACRIREERSMTPRLSQSFPWSEEELGGFAVSAVVGSVLFALLYAWMQEPDAGTMMNLHVPMGSPAYRIRIPDPTYVPPIVVGILILFGLILLNVSPVKKLHGFGQFLICAAAGAVLDRHEWALDGVVVSAIKAGSYGFPILTTYRAN